jgi:cytochrome c
MRLSRIAIVTLMATAFTASQAFAEGDADAGAKVFNKCKACHKLDGGKGPGPTLQGMFGRQAGTVEGFKYSADMVAAGEAGLVWNEENFLKFVEDPRDYLGEVLGKKKSSTRMIVKISKESEREDLLAFLLANGAKQ